MSKFELIPVDVFLDDLFPLLELADLLRLSQVNKFLAALGENDALWRRKLLEDLNYFNFSNARTTGFKFLYKRLRNPKVFVWG